MPAALAREGRAVIGWFAHNGVATDLMLTGILVSGISTPGSVA